MQIQAKHTGCRSQYRQTAKSGIKELYKLNIEDPGGYPGSVEYLLAEDRFIYPLGSDDLSF